MPPAKKFRIETTNADAQTPEAAAENRHEELVALLDGLKKSVAGTVETVNETFVTEYRGQIDEARKLKAELDEIHEAIGNTKRELANLHVNGLEGDGMGKVTNELDAIVDGTENATESILAAAESIDNVAAELAASLVQEANRAQATDIQDQVIKIFEACNFQDLTGQRITKVVRTLGFVEDRVNRMMTIWGGIEEFRGIETDQEEKCGDAALLNGPALPDDASQVSQDDIDALFD
ncbi:MAG: protein phosphatase CheZ [Pseudomonadota bacterium]